MTALSFQAAGEVLRRAHATRVFPAACAEVGTSTRPLWRESVGRLTYDPASPRAADDTVFDLASLTKVLSTAPLVMRQIERSAIDLDDRVSRYLAEWTGDDRQAVTIRDLLSHSSGLPAHRPFHLERRGRAAIQDAIVTCPLEYAPRAQSIYSDLGFMLLGFILDDIAPLPRQFDTLRDQMGGIQDLQFHPPGIWKPRTAPTRIDERRGPIRGEVDDDNAWALEGAAGHAGLFGTVGAVGECARHVLQVLAGRVGAYRRETLQTFIARRADIPGSSRALGWDTMLPTSSCGARMSPRAFGHTGFTGTSLWIDPDAGIYAVLLTNRVHPTAENDAIREVRRAFHDEVMRSLEG